MKPIGTAILRDDDKSLQFIYKGGYSETWLMDKSEALTLTFQYGVSVYAILRLNGGCAIVYGNSDNPEVWVTGQAALSLEDAFKLIEIAKTIAGD